MQPPSSPLIPYKLLPLALQTMLLQLQTVIPRTPLYLSIGVYVSLGVYFNLQLQPLLTNPGIKEVP